MVTYLLLDEAEDEDILIKRHLLHDYEKFRAFFKLNIHQFDYLLELVKEELTNEPCNRIPQPITAAEKLVITLSSSGIVLSPCDWSKYILKNAGAESELVTELDLEKSCETVEHAVLC
ncbi:hypothetical protein PR048_004777 [Dryococelus australis]|uniref:Uncharacterized protein n=1 Tax=Dryococelus australis TaxID=614101 RepID=A0ABQ9I6C9_9NEOP|nr:hypothetical protein PR048_004777 [Dryococelus australis]